MSSQHLSLTQRTLAGTFPRCAQVCLLLAIITAAAFAGYQQTFSTFVAYDDEGYVMLSLRSYMEGMPLYDDTYSQYGPAYYLLHSLIHSSFDLSLTHDVSRFKTLAQWLLAALLGSLFLYRVTDSPVVALVGFTILFFHLDRLGVDPGHPQEMCTLFIAGSLLLGSLVGGNAANGWVSVAMGAVVAATAMTKVNIGVLLFVAVSIAMLLAMAPSPSRRFLLALFLGTSFLLPLMMVRGHMFSIKGLQLPVVVIAATATTAYVACRVPFGPVLRHRHLFMFWVSSACVSALIVAATIANGTSPSGLIYGLMLQHTRFIDVFYQHPPVLVLSAPFAVAAALAAVASIHGVRRADRFARLIAIVLAVSIGIRQLVETFWGLDHGGDDRGHAAVLMGLATSILWILLAPMVNGTAKPSWLADRYFARLMLCTVAILQPLIVYPIPGTQMAVGSLGLVLAVLVCIGDNLQIEHLLGKHERLLRYGPVAALAVLSVVTLMCRDLHSWRSRRELVPLNLPGANRLRLSPDTVERTQWIVSRLRNESDTFISMPNGFNSLYFWTELKPPTALNTTLWLDLLDDRQQQEILESLSSHHRAAVAVDRNGPWPDRADLPIIDYVKRHFESVEKHGSIELWLRKDRTSNTATRNSPVDAEATKHNHDRPIWSAS